MREILYLIPIALGGMAFYWDGKKDDYRLDDAVQKEYARLSSLMFKALIFSIGVLLVLFASGKI